MGLVVHAPVKNQEADRSHKRHQPDEEQLGLLLERSELVPPNGHKRCDSVERNCYGERDKQQVGHCVLSGSTAAATTATATAATTAVAAAVAPAPTTARRPTTATYERAAA